MKPTASDQIVISAGTPMQETKKCSCCNAMLDYLPYDGLLSDRSVYFNCFCGSILMVKEVMIMDPDPEPDYDGYEFDCRDEHDPTL